MNQTTASTFSLVPTSSGLPEYREARASETAFPSWSLGTSQMSTRRAQWRSVLRRMGGIIHIGCNTRQAAIAPLDLRTFLVAGDQAGYLIVIHKSGKAGKAVISAGMPKSRPWTVTSRLYKCLMQSDLPTRSLPSVDTGTPVVTPSLPSLDAGFRHPCRNDGLRPTCV